MLPSLAGGGAERVNLDLAYEFKKIGHEVDFVLCNATGIFLTEAKEHFNVIDLKLSTLLKLPYRLAEYIDREHPDVIIVSMWGLTALAPLAKFISKIKPKMLLVEHSSLVNQFKNSRLRTKLFLRFSTYISYRLADELAGVSSGVALDMKIVARLKKKDVHVLYNPIPHKPISSRRKLDECYRVWASNSYRVLTVGSFKEAKNHELLLKAFAIVTRTLKAKLMILGQGDLEVDVIESIKDKNISDDVLLPGFYHDTAPFYYTADLFVLSSDREGLPTVLIEALGCGLPVVSTDCEHGPAEILNLGEFGELVPVGDEVALANAIIKSLYSTHDKDRLINRAQYFAPEIAAKRYLQVLGDENE